MRNIFATLDNTQADAFAEDIIALEADRNHWKAQAERLSRDLAQERNKAKWTANRLAAYDTITDQRPSEDIVAHLTGCHENTILNNTEWLADNQEDGDDLRAAINEADIELAAAQLVTMEARAKRDAANDRLSTHLLDQHARGECPADWCYGCAMERIDQN